MLRPDGSDRPPSLPSLASSFSYPPPSPFTLTNTNPSHTHSQHIPFLPLLPPLNSLTMAGPSIDSYSEEQKLELVTSLVSLPSTRFHDPQITIS